MRFSTFFSLLFWSFISCGLGQDEFQKRWSKQDANGDGKLAKSEVSGLMAKYFDRNDKNSDGFLDQSELTDLADRLKKRNVQQQRKKPTPTMPENVELRKNLRYREGHARWVVDLYLPKDAEEKEQLRPGIVFVHGGGWKSGSKDGGVWSALPAAYAAKGYVCISVNYRLTGQGGGYPQCVHDVKNAVRWFRANADEFRLDPKRIGAYGNSAGAHLVSMLGLVQKEAGLEGDGTHLEQSSMVQAVCASATPSNFLNWGKPGHGPDKFGFLKSNSPEDDIRETAKQASPVSHAFSEAPPFLLYHAKDDRVVPYIQGTALENALKEVGASVTLKSYDDGGHGVFRAKQSESYPTMEAFFGEHLGLKND